MTDVAGLRGLHDAHVQSLWAYVLSLTGGDREQAEDVVQETLLRAWRRLDVDHPAPRAWLFTVARNLVVDHWRSPSSRERLIPEVPEPREPNPDESDRLLESWVVAEALTRLTVDHRRVVVECYYRGSSVAEAAERLGIPEGTVKSRAHYALRALRVVLDEMGLGERGDWQ